MTGRCFLSLLSVQSSIRLKNEIHILILAIVQSSSQWGCLAIIQSMKESLTVAIYLYTSILVVQAARTKCLRVLYSKGANSPACSKSSCRSGKGTPNFQEVLGTRRVTKSPILEEIYLNLNTSHPCFRQQFLTGLLNPPVYLLNQRQ
jgi:hypothetical protein